ncbi:MAG: SBBP repeat-containing protein [Abitibacteriaceae bacterium]|nr:SBBP repeat-containing protein [Abditibacteriaceae bacterium]
MEYDFIVAPGTNPNSIKLAITGAKHLSINPKGELIVDTGNGQLIEHSPVIYQEVNGSKRHIQGGYILQGQREVGFRLAAYDTSKSIIIDPVLTYSSFLGGSGEDYGYGVATDSSSNTYITGDCHSSDFPTKNSSQPISGNAFITKLDAVSGSLIYSTHIGGGNDFGRAIAVDSSGNAYITGFTSARNFPLKNPQQSTIGASDYDGFVTEISSSGASLVFSTYLGGNGNDEGFGIAVDNFQHIYITGLTTSSDLATKNGYQPVQIVSNDQDAFMVKYDVAGSSVLYSTYLGGSSSDYGAAIAVDDAGNAYVTGDTSSTDFPITLGCFQPTPHSQTDAFVTKLDTTKSGTASLSYSTFLGGSTGPGGVYRGEDMGYGIQVDSGGNAVVVGATSSTDFPIVNAIQPFGSGDDAFVCKINASGSGLIFSTYLGGSSFDQAEAVAIDYKGNIYVTGTTGSTDFPLQAPVQANYGGGGDDAFVTKLDSTGSNLVYSTYLGGNNYEEGKGIAVDKFERAHVAGFTVSPNFPTISASQTTFGGRVDAFAARFSTTNNMAVVTTTNDVVANDGVTSLREAINFANSNPNTAIYFAIPPTDPGFSAGVFTIRPGSQLPALTANNTIIDGNSQARSTGSTNTVGPEIMLDGTTSPTNTDGLTITASHCSISGLVISGFTHGININGATATNNMVFSNYIGTDATGAMSSGNTEGITVNAGASSNIIGRSGPGEANVIAYNTTDGVQIGGDPTLSSVGNSVRYNRIFSNGGLGINLTTGNEAYNTVTPNDPGDIDSGGNNLQNYPVITSATFANNNTTISGTLNSTANMSFAIDFYINSSADSSGYGEGESYIGTQNVATDANGNATFAFNVSGDLSNQFVSSTATAPNGDTSEFSQDQIVIAQTLTLSINPSSFSEAAGDGAAIGTVTRSTSTSVPLTIDLSSSKHNKAITPPTVTIPVGATSATFSIDAVDNTLVDGDQTISFVASHAGFDSGTASVTVTDNDVPTLSLSITPNIFSEGAGVNAAKGTVTRNTPTNSALTVNLSNSDPNSAQVPASVTIPAGAASVNFSVGAVDNNIVDGSRPITVTATAPGFMAGAASATVLDNDGPTLTLSINPGSFSEGAGSGAAVGIVSRNTATTDTLTVSLNSGNTGKVQVPASITIPAGAAATTFPVMAVDDAVACGTQSVTVTANAASFNPGVATVSVTDDDIPTLVLSVTPSTFTEDAKSVTGTVARNTPISFPLVVDLSSSNPDRVTVPTTVTIPAGATTVDFPITPVEDSIANGNEPVALIANAPNFVFSKATVTIVDNDSPALHLSVSPATFSEAAGPNAAVGIVTRNFALNTDAVVSLASNNLGAATVPTNVTIPAGATSTIFSVAAVDDNIAAGNQTATITAMTSGFSDAAIVTVTDNETRLLSLSVTPPSFSETVRSITGTIARNTPATSPLTVSLSSDAPGRLHVPATVTIPAGATSTTFVIPVVDNSIADGHQTISLVASADGFAPSNTALTITDNEVPTLTLQVSRDHFSENAGKQAAVGIVTRNTPTTTALRVTLGSGDANEVRVPASVLIPIGATSIRFSIEAVNDHVAAGPSRVTLMANAIGFVPGTATVTVTDTDAVSSLGIGGRITADGTRGKVGIGQAIVSLFSGSQLLDITKTDASGNYLFTHLPNNTYTITVSKINYKFAVRSRTFDLNSTRHDIDFSATPVPGISGRVTQRKSDGTAIGLAGVTVTARAGSIVLSAHTDRNGQYTLTPKSVGIYIITASLGNAAFTPPSQSVNLTASTPVAQDINFSQLAPLLSSGQTILVAKGIMSGVALSTSSANAATDSVQLRFNGALDAETASDPTHYTVEVNGKAVAVESASYNASTHAVVLAVSHGTLHSGDQVVVSWSDVADAKGATLPQRSNSIIAH